VAGHRSQFPFLGGGVLLPKAIMPYEERGSTGLAMIDRLGDPQFVAAMHRIMDAFDNRGWALRFVGKVVPEIDADYASHIEAILEAASSLGMKALAEQSLTRLAIRFTIEQLSALRAIACAAREKKALRKILCEAWPHDTSSCANCGSSDAKLSACATCRLVKYCSRSCQKANWKEHKDACRAYSMSEGD